MCINTNTHRDAHIYTDAHICTHAQYQPVRRQKCLDFKNTETYMEWLYFLSKCDSAKFIDFVSSRRIRLKISL